LSCFLQSKPLFAGELILQMGSVASALR